MKTRQREQAIESAFSVIFSGVFFEPYCFTFLSLDFC